MTDSIQTAVQRIFLALAVVLSTLLATAANAETRTLKMYFTHTKESATITFKRNGRYDSAGLKKMNRFLRDWRRKESTKMDPALFDLVWETYQKAGGRKGIHVISGYRSPKTNNMLRSRGRAVAKSSQHTQGKALDFFIPGVSVTKLRELGLQAHRGGVGYYSGAFVHLDTGRVRHWPRMSPRQLAKVFPDGKTIHVPSNGRPMKGYKVAMANLQKGLNADGSRRGSSVKPSLLARLFSRSGDDGDEGETNDKDVAPTPAEKPAPARKPAKAEPVLVAKAEPKAAPLPDAQSGPNVFAQEALSAKEAARLASEAEAATQIASLVSERPIAPRFRPAAPAAVAPESAVVLAALAPEADASTQNAAVATEYAFAAPSVSPVRRPGADIPVGSVSEPTKAAQAATVPLPRVSTDAVAEPVQVASAEPVLPASPKQLAEEAASVVAKQVVPAKKAPAKDLASLNSAVTKTLDASSTRMEQLKRDAEEAIRVADAAAALAKEGEKRRQDLLAAARKLPSKRPVKAEAQTEVAALAPASEPAAPVAKPASKPVVAVTQPTRRSGFVIRSEEAMRSDLSLGNLETVSVKAWATAGSIRVGPVAQLRAPAYRMAAASLPTAAVYSSGFVSSHRPLRADRFTGSSLTRLAQATILN